MLGDLPDQRLAVGVRHPVARLDLLLGRHDRVEIVERLSRAGGIRPAARRGLVERALGVGYLIEQGLTRGIIRGHEIVAVHLTSVTATSG